MIVKAMFIKIMVFSFELIMLLIGFIFHFTKYMKIMHIMNLPEVVQYIEIVMFMFKM